MTREEVVDKLEELAKAVRADKKMQQAGMTEDGWCDIKHNQLEYFVNTLRIAPDPKYVPFTADDWREFKNSRIQTKSFSHFVSVLHWDELGFIAPSGFRIYYDDALSNYVLVDTGKPCGKEVKE